MVVYFKILEDLEGVIVEKQKIATVISEHFGYIKVSFKINGETVIRALSDDEYSETPYLMTFKKN